MINDLTIKINNFKVDDEKYSFLKEYDIKAKLEEEYFVFDDNEFNIHCIGKTLEELLQEIYEELAFMYDAYVLEDDKKLNKKAIELKNKLAGLYKRED